MQLPNSNKVSPYNNSLQCPNGTTPLKCLKIRSVSQPKTVVHLLAICAKSRPNLNYNCSTIGFRFLFVIESHKNIKAKI